MIADRRCERCKAAALAKDDSSQTKETTT